MGQPISLFAVIIVQRIRADELARREGDAPLVAIGIVVRFAERIIGDDIEDEVLGGVVDNLVRFGRLEDEGVSCLDGGLAIFMPDRTAAGNDVVEFPLRAVGVVGIWSLARWDAAYLDIEGMPLVQIGGLRVTAQRL